MEKSTSAESIPAPPSSRVTCGTWSEDARSSGAPEVPELDAAQEARRAKLARVVRGVVAASALLCVSALGRATVQWASGDAPEVSHAARVSMRDRPVIGTFRTVHEDAATDVRSKRGPKRGSGRATASRSRPW